MKLCVISDDFTGANDIGIRIAKYGLRVVSLNEDADIDCDVKIINTESRNIDSARAKKKVSEIYHSAVRSGFDRFYKKIDSTLRGNIVSELNGILEHLPENEYIAFTPSFPSAGRTVSNGILYVNGVRVNESGFANDPLSPVAEADILKIIPDSVLITNEDIDNNNIEKIEALKKQGKKIFVFDSDTEIRLRNAAIIMNKTGLDRITAGSAGIMRYFPEIWNITKERVLIITGSCSHTDIEQSSEFTQNSCEFDVFKVDVKNLDYSIIEEIKKSRKNIFIKSIDNVAEADDVYDYYSGKGIDREFAGKKIAEFMGNIASETVNHFGINKIMTSGGETSHAVMNSLGEKAIRIIEEVETGIPFSYTYDMKYSIVTKSGSFGTKKIYFRGYEKLKSAENRE